MPDPRHGPGAVRPTRRGRGEAHAGRRAAAVRGPTLPGGGIVAPLRLARPGFISGSGGERCADAGAIGPPRRNRNGLGPPPVWVEVVWRRLPSAAAKARRAWRVGSVAASLAPLPQESRSAHIPRPPPHPLARSSPAERDSALSGDLPFLPLPGAPRRPGLLLRRRPPRDEARARAAALRDAGARAGALMHAQRHLLARGSLNLPAPASPGRERPRAVRGPPLQERLVAHRARRRCDPVPRWAPAPSRAAALLSKPPREQRAASPSDLLALPAPGTSGGAAFLSSRDGSAWPVLLEKAWAKAHGSYQAAARGFLGDVLRDLTGAPAEPLAWDSTWEGDDQRATAPASLARALEKARGDYMNAAPKPPASLSRQLHASRARAPPWTPQGWLVGAVARARPAKPDEARAARHLLEGFAYPVTAVRGDRVSVLDPWSADRKGRSDAGAASGRPGRHAPCPASGPPPLTRPRLASPPNRLARSEPRQCYPRDEPGGLLHRVLLSLRLVCAPCDSSSSVPRCSPARREALRRAR